MSDGTTKIHIGLTSARELELEVGDPESVVSDLEAAFRDGTRIIWITDAEDHRHGIVVEKVAFLEVERTKPKGGVGFSSKD